MSARTLGPPGNDAGPQVQDDQGAEHVEAAAAKRPLLSSSLNRATVAAHERRRHDVESYLRTLIAMCEDPPLIADLVEADLGTPRGTASIARAALRWLLDGTDDAIRRRLVDELETADLIARWRVRMAGHDVRGTTDWTRVQAVAWARREAA